MKAPNAWQVLIDKHRIDAACLENAADSAAVNDGEIAVALTRCGMSANNVTYAALGNGFGPGIDMPGYWTVFPSGVDGKGLLPVWGFAVVTSSCCEAIAEGETLYGYFPLAASTVLRPTQISSASFTDGSEHRREVAAVYNQYLRLAALPPLSEQERSLWPVFRPLLLTGFMIADQFDEAGSYGADLVVIASASSKTAMMSAFCLNAIDNCPRLVGLTSAGNADYVKATGLYESVVVYDDLAALERTGTAAYVDMAGNRALTRSVHEHFGDALAFSLMVGMSHWRSAGGKGPSTGPEISPFFAPGRIKKRVADWGSTDLRKRTEHAWQGFIEFAPSMTDVVIHTGRQAALECYLAAVDGDMDPRQAVLIDLETRGFSRNL